MSDSAFHMTSSLDFRNKQGLREYSVRRSIIVRFERAGFHSYPDAPEPVAYLRLKHRHMFHFELELPVNHDNRELEFHMVKMWATDLIGDKFDMDGHSCEWLAQRVVEEAIEKYGVLWAECMVWEDKECGARVRLEATGV